MEYTAVHFDKRDHRNGFRLSRNFTQSQCDLRSLGDNNVFFYDVTKLFVENDIPLTKLNCADTRRFFKSYTNLHLPDVALSQEIYVDKILRDTYERIRRGLTHQHLWISIETTDVVDKCICSFVVGVLNEDKPQYVANVGVLRGKTQAEVGRFIMESVQNVDLDLNDALVCLTSGELYMQQASVT